MGSGGTYTIFKISSGTLSSSTLVSDSTLTGFRITNGQYFKCYSNGRLSSGSSLSTGSLANLANASTNPTFSVTLPPNYILLGSVAVAGSNDTGMKCELVEVLDSFSPFIIDSGDAEETSLSINPSIDNLYTGYDSGISVTITPECAISGYAASTIEETFGKIAFTYKVTVYILAQYISQSDLYEI